MAEKKRNETNHSRGHSMNEKNRLRKMAEIGFRPSYETDGKMGKDETADEKERHEFFNFTEASE